MFLMIGGISLIGVVTATVARWMVTEVEADDRAQQAVTVAHIDELHAAIARLEKLVAANAKSPERIP